MAEIGAVNSLVSELLASGRAKANNAVKLLALMVTCKQEAALKAAIQGLKQFFVAAGQDGLLPAGDTSGSASRPAKRQKVASNAASSAAATNSASDGAAAATGAGANAATPADAEVQYREWLRRQYGNFVSQLLALVTGAAHNGSGVAAPLAPRSAGVQVVAAAALMECVRSEMGPGTFSGILYGRLLSSVLLSPEVRPEVFALLFNKYLQMADVRFYTLATIKAIAARYSRKAHSASAAGEEQEHEQGGEEKLKGVEEEEEAAAAGAATAAAADAVATAAVGAGAGGGGGVVSLPDLARNAYDVLCHVAETLPVDTREWSTWCGAAEYNLVVAAADKNESAKLRRKRKEQEEREKQQQQRQGQKQAADSSGKQQLRVQWANTLTQRRLYGDAWLALLALPLPSDVLRKALFRLPASVIPHMTGPQLLADFLTHCLNRGGLTGMLALNGLFLLVTRHGLEYPQFYSRLYQLLVPEVFAARTRAQFFRLADIFLSSSLVPAYTVAAFIKRFARLALGAPPAGAMIAIAFIHNLLRRHPALNVMLHKPIPSGDGDGDGGAVSASNGGPALPEPAEAEAAASRSGLGVDPYDGAEVDPAKSRAVESSLWEVEALRNHYCPQVSTFCTVLDKDLTDRKKTAEVDLEGLLGISKGDGQQPGGVGSYNALIHGELARKLRKAPVAFYPQPPTSLFPTNLCANEWPGWAFNP